jgi:hypothetical protein
LPRSLRLCVIPLRAEEIVDLLVGVAFSLELVNSIKNSLHLDKLSACINVKEDSIVQALHLAGVTWPDKETVVLYILSVPLYIEELRQLANLLVVLVVKTPLDYFSYKVHNVRKVLLPKMLCLLVEGKG